MQRLFQAAQTGDIDAIKRLISDEKGDNVIAYVNQQDGTGVSSMHIAAHEGYLDIVQFLYESGASTDLIDSNKATPLHLAASSGKIEICEFLVKQNAILDPRVCFSFTMFLFLSKNCFIFIYNSTPLHKAVQNGFAEIVDYFAREGADVNALNVAILFTECLLYLNRKFFYSY